MTGKLDKYIIDVDYDYETGEEHTTVLKTDQTQNMENWETLVIAMYVHHSIFEDVVAELNRLNEENQKLTLRINTFTEGNKTLQARLKEVSTENKNTKAVLEDFMDILNKIQMNPTDEKLLNIARDMLQNMGYVV